MFQGVPEAECAGRLDGAFHRTVKPHKDVCGLARFRVEFDGLAFVSFPDQQPALFRVVGEEAAFKRAVLADVNGDGRVFSGHGDAAVVLHVVKAPLAGVALYPSPDAGGVGTEKLLFQLVRHLERPALGNFRHLSRLVDAQDAEVASLETLHEVEAAGILRHGFEQHLEPALATLGRDVTPAQRDALAPDGLVPPPAHVFQEGFLGYLDPPPRLIPFVETQDGGRVRELHVRDSDDLRRAAQP